MNLFGKARINVNLLIHFINSKFYGRKHWKIYEKNTIILSQVKEKEKEKRVADWKEDSLGALN